MYFRCNICIMYTPLDAILQQVAFFVVLLLIQKPLWTITYQGGSLIDCRKNDGCCLCKGEPIKQHQTTQQRFARKILEVVGAAGFMMWGNLLIENSGKRGIDGKLLSVSVCFLIDIWELLSLEQELHLVLSQFRICEPIQEEQKEFALAYKLSQPGQNACVSTAIPKVS